MAANEFEMINRYKKARKLADVLRDVGARSDWVADSTPQGRRDVETLAGVNRASDICWALTAYLLEEGR